MADIVNDLGVEIINISHLCVTNEKEITGTKRLLGIPVSTSWPDLEGYIGTFNGIDPEVVVQEMKGLYSNSKALIYQSPQMPQEKTNLYYSKKPFQLRKQCFSPWFKVHIKSNGDVMPCSDFIVGNIHKKAFKDIWN
jgi:MoaA/NifB/PqqE/SkfB family radical SAM enzyme